MIKRRDFYEELKHVDFRQVTYTIFNKLDEDQYVRVLEKQIGKLLAIDDFEYYDFELSKLEKILIVSKVKCMMEDIDKLRKEIVDRVGMKLYLDTANGGIRVIKLTSVKL